MQIEDMASFTYPLLIARLLHDQPANLESQINRIQESVNRRRSAIGDDVPPRLVERLIEDLDAAQESINDARSVLGGGHAEKHAAIG